MKRILLSLAVVLSLGGPATVSAQRHYHRHTPRTESVGNTDKKPTAGTAAEKTEADGDEDGIEAYSDTSSVAGAADSAVSMDENVRTESVDDSNRYSPKRFDDPLSWFMYLCSTSFWGVIFTILFVVLGLLFLFMPLIIVLLIIRYFVRRHNDRVRLAEKAMESGQPLTEEDMPLSKKSPDYMWRRGVRNVSIGAGLMLFFWFLGATPLAGIGGLVACLGAGQMFMVRYNYNSSFGRGRRKDEGRFGGFDDLGDDISDLRFGDDEKNDGQQK